MRVASDKDSTDELWQWYLLVGAQHLSIGGTGCQGSKHTVVTMVADERTTSGHNISLQQQRYYERMGTATNTTITTNPTS